MGMGWIKTNTRTNAAVAVGQCKIFERGAFERKGHFAAVAAAVIFALALSGFWTVKGWRERGAVKGAEFQFVCIYAFEGADL